MRIHKFKRLHQGMTLHATFKGEVNLSDLTAAIRECSRLLLDGEDIRHLIIDTINTAFLNLSCDDIRAVARQAAMLTTIQRDLVIVGVMDKNFDFGLFRMWATYVELDPLKVPACQIQVVRRLDEALLYIESLIQEIRDSLSHSHAFRGPTVDCPHR